jgi:putative SOS response-associated peptidase YedK
MCGRAILVSSVEEIAEIFGVDPIPIGPPRFNVAPGQDVLAVRQPFSSSSGRGEAPDRRELAMLRWGLLPSAKDRTVRSKTIQARVETIARAPTYREAFRNRRCLVVVSGFYEWSGSGQHRQPHRICLASGKPFAIAGIWDVMQTDDGALLESCAVVTTPARGAVAALHDRMPLVLDAASHERWLSAPPDEAQRLVADVERLVVFPVSTWVNDVRNDDPRCLLSPEEGPKPAQTTLPFA